MSECVECGNVVNDYAPVKQGGVKRSPMSDRILIDCKEAAAMMMVSEMQIRALCKEELEGYESTGFPVMRGNYRGYRIHKELLKEWVREKIVNKEAVLV